MAAPGSPVSRAATSAYRARAGWPGAPARSAATFASMTGASSAAQATPCGTAILPPSTPASPWTAPSFALARAIPPATLATAMSARASRSAPSA